MDRYDRERETARQLRKRDAVLSGISKSKDPQRGDYKFCRDMDKLWLDRKKHGRDKEAVNKIDNEIDLAQREGRKRP